MCVQSPPYSSGGSYDSVKMELSAEDLSMGRHGSQIAPDDDDDDHDDHDDNDKINDVEGVDPERLKAFNVSRNTGLRQEIIEVILWKENGAAETFSFLQPR